MKLTKLFKVVILLLIFFSSQNAFSTRYYVATNGDGTTGLSWVEAFTDIQTAINASSSGDEIWVKEGVYYADGTDRSVSINLKSGVKLYGGFDASEITIQDRSMSDFNGNGIIEPWEFASSSVLSGEIQQDGDKTNNTQHIIVIPDGVEVSTLLDGFTVENGYSDLQSNTPYNSNVVYASGIISLGGVVRNCKVQNCESQSAEVSYGGGVFAHNSEVAGCFIDGCLVGGSSVYGSGIVLINSRFQKSKISNCNLTSISNGIAIGGGLYSEGSVIDSCQISSCTSDAGGGSKGWGGGMYNSSSNVIDCSVNNCKASGIQGYGGGVYGISSTYINTLVFNNESNAYAGGFYGLSAYFTNGVVTRNKVTGTNSIGGGAYGDAGTTFFNTVFWRNQSAGTSQQLRTSGGEVRNCALQNEDLGINNNISISENNTGSIDGVMYAMFVSPTTFVGLSGGDISKEAELAVADWSIDMSSSLIEKGNNVAFEEAHSLVNKDLNGDGDNFDIIDHFTDLSNELRLFNRNVDIGAYEPAFINLVLPDDPTVEYGLTLGEVAIVGGSATDKRDGSVISGVFSFTDASTVPPFTGGRTKYRVVFTPDDLSNYVEMYDSISVTITPKELSLSGLTADDKIYDGNTSVSFSGTAVLEGVVGSDNVVLNVGNISASFVDKNVGTDKDIIFSGFTLTGADAGNYTLSQSSGTASITPKAITTSALTANDKVYDGNADATYQGTPVPVGVVSGDDVAIDASSGLAVFDNKKVNINKNVTFSGFTITGADAGNYTISQPVNSMADITSLVVFVEGITVEDKVYDGNTNAVKVGTPVVNGILNSDDVTLNTTTTSVQFEDENAGASKLVVFSGYFLMGSDADNYTLNQPSSVTAAIIQKELSIDGIVAQDKVYDGSSSATYTGNPNLVGKISGDDVTLVSSAAAASFESPDAGVNQNVSFNGFDISGADRNNYLLIQPSSIASINPVDIVIQADNKTKPYNTDDPVLTYTISGSLVAGDNFTGELSRDVGEDVGEYTISQGSLQVSSNYNISFTSGVFEITKASNVINFSLDSPVTYGEVEQIVLSASSNSGLPLIFTSSNEEIASVSGNTLTIKSYGVVTITAEEGGEDSNFEKATPVSVGLTINLNVKAIAKGENMLLIDNSDKQFVGYQWYQNGSQINGAEKQYYYSESGLTGVYYCVVTTINGDELTSNSINKSAPVAGMSVYPSPALKNASFNVEIQSANVEDIHTSTLKVYSITGKLMKQVDNLTEINQLFIEEPGIYILKIEGAIQVVKKIIVK